MRTLDEVIEIASDWTNEFDEMSTGRSGNEDNRKNSGIS